MVRMTAAKERQTEQRLARRAEALDAAMVLFSTKGFAGTTLADVAKAIGVGAPALYYYFASKEALLFAGLERVMVKLNAALDAALVAENGDPALRLRALVVAQVIEEARAVDTMPMINSYLYGALRNAAHFSPDQINRLRVLQRHIVDLYRALLSEGQALGVFRVLDITPTAFAILGLAQYVSSWYRPGTGRMELSAIADHHADLALRGVLA
jgi:AcrR family transcriptional regulator